MVNDTIGGLRDMLVKELHVTPRLCHVFVSGENLAVVTTTTENLKHFVYIISILRKILTLREE